MVARIQVRGSVVPATPTINRGTAFTEEERRGLGLTGLPPTGVTTIDGQVRRTYAQFSAQTSPLRKWVYLAILRDRNEVLFYRLLSGHISETMPIVYTPTVGLAIERFSHEFRRPRGVFLSVDHPEDVETALRNTGWARRTWTCWSPPTPRGSGPRRTLRPAHRRLRQRGGQVVPARDAALGERRGEQRAPGAAPLRRPGLHVQRRHAGHRGGRAGRGAVGHPRRRQPDGRAAGPDPRRRHRRGWGSRT
jgi:hypothetical protein